MHCQSAGEYSTSSSVRTLSHIWAVTVSTSEPTHDCCGGVTCTDVARSLHKRATSLQSMQDKNSTLSFDNPHVQSSVHPSTGAVLLLVMTFKICCDCWSWAAWERRPGGKRKRGWNRQGFTPRTPRRDRVCDRRRWSSCRRWDLTKSVSLLQVIGGELAHAQTRNFACTLSRLTGNAHVINTTEF